MIVVKPSERSSNHAVAEVVRPVELSDSASKLLPYPEMPGAPRNFFSELEETRCAITYRLLMGC